MVQAWGLAQVHHEGCHVFLSVARGSLMLVLVQVVQEEYHEFLWERVAQVGCHVDLSREVQMSFLDLSLRDQLLKGWCCLVETMVS